MTRNHSIYISTNLQFFRNPKLINFYRTPLDTALLVTFYFISTFISLMSKIVIKYLFFQLFYKKIYNLEF